MILTILDKPVADLDTLSAAELSALEVALDNEAATLKARKEKFVAVMIRRFDEKAHAELVRSGRDTGTVSVAASNSLTVKVEYKKAVVWDQPKLLAALNELPAATAKHFAKVEVKVDERKYTAAEPRIQAHLAPARTVKVGKPSFTFKDETREAA